MIQVKTKEELLAAIQKMKRACVSVNMNIENDNRTITLITFDDSDERDAYIYDIGMFTNQGENLKELQLKPFVAIGEVMAELRRHVVIYDVHGKPQRLQ